MKKGLKILSTSLLLSSLFVAGCSCGKDDGKNNVSRMDNSADSLASLKGSAVDGYTLQDIYDALIAADTGNNTVANKMIEIVANDVLDLDNNESVWKKRYDAIVKEKLTELAKSDSYKFDGEFSEKLMQATLNYEGYTITCTAGTYGSVEDLKCDYTDYVNKKIKMDTLTILLKQKYIQDVALEERTNILTTKKIRDVEYFTVSSSLNDSYDDLNVRDFMRELRDKIAANQSEVIFADVEAELKQDMEDIVEKEYLKIGTSEDYSQSIITEYTNNYTQDKSVGYDKKLAEIAAKEFTFNKVIGSDSESDAVISDVVTSSLLSITNPADASFARRTIKIGNHYYLVNANAGVEIDEKDILLSESSDSSYTYSIVRFKVINSDSEDEKDVYKAIEMLAEKSTLANGAVAHYLKENKDAISVYDDGVKAYLEKLYPDIFAE